MFTTNLLTGDASSGERYVVSVDIRSNNHGFNFGLGFSFSRDSFGTAGTPEIKHWAVIQLRQIKNNKQNQIFRTTLGVDTVERYDIEKGAWGKVQLATRNFRQVELTERCKWSYCTSFAYQDWANIKSLDLIDDGV
jgi:hypothetical protein